MAAQDQHDVPVWTISTEDLAPDLPLSMPDDSMTSEHLARLREVLAVMASCPVVTVEAHSLPRNDSRAGGLSLDALSPLAKELTMLINDSAHRSPAVSNLQKDGEVLYRVTIPPQVANQVQRGEAQLMTSRNGADGVHSAVVSKKGGVLAQATFTPVPAAGAGVTVAPVLIVAAVAAGLFVQAEMHHADLAARIDNVVTELREQSLDRRRDQLNGSVSAIELATAVLLDKGKLGLALGLDSAAHSINTAVEAARTDVQRWQKVLSEVGDGPVEPRVLEKNFPGWDDENGEFDQRLQLAELAISLRRRLTLIQAVDQAQSDPDNQFASFVGALRRNQRDIDALEQQFADVVQRMSQLRLCAPKGTRSQMMTRGAVDELLRDSYRLLERGETRALPAAGALSIDMIRSADGSLKVLPAAE